MTSRQTRFVLVLTSCVAALGAITLAVSPIIRPDAGTWAWGILAGLVYALSDNFPVRIESRGEVHTISSGEIGLALALTHAGRGPLLVAIAIAFAGVVISYRTLPLIKTTFAAAVLVAVWGSSTLVYATVAEATPFGPRMWLGLLLAIVVCSAVSHVATWAVMSVANGAVEPLSPILFGLAVSAINAILGATVVEIVSVDWRSVWMIGALAVGLWFGYRSYLRLMQRYGNLDLLHTFSHGLTGLTDSGQIAATTLTMAKELLRGEIAELVFRLPDGVLVKCLSDEGALTVRAFRSGKLPPEHTLLAFDAGVVVRENDTFLAHRELVEHLGWRDLASAPIGAEGFEGVLVVANRLAESSTFDDEDLRVLETFAKNTGVALKVGELVDELRREAAEKEFESLHDSLTGLPNRERFEQVLAGALLPSATSEALVAVLVMDLNDFKDVNDSLGHSTGDSLLEEIGRRLASAIDSRSATVARLGSDEFAVVVGGLRAVADVVDYADALRRAVEEPYLVDQLSVAVRFSVGVAVAPTHGSEPRILIQRADIAMYAAKHSVNGVMVYSPELDKASLRRLSLAGELQPALDNSEFQLFYQPQLDLVSGRVVAVEALARWPHAVHKSVPPDEFIPLVEQSGLIGPFTRWAIGTALADVALWREEFPDLRVSVNMSARNLLDHEFPETVRSLLDEHGLGGEALTLELTESTVMDEPERSLRVLDALHAMGIRIAIDDFGTGYSSLSYLKRLPVAEVKIDKSFVMNMVGNCDDTAIVRSTIDLARNLGMETVAEGVETMAAMEQLRGLGCWAAQGYHLSRPIPAVDVAAKVRDLDGKYSTVLPERPTLAHHARRSA